MKRSHSPLTVITVPELAKLLKVSSSNIDRYMDAKIIIPCEYIHGRRAWLIADLTRHFEQHEDLWDKLIDRVNRCKRNRRTPCDQDQIRSILQLPPKPAEPRSFESCSGNISSTDPILIANEKPKADNFSNNGPLEAVVLDIVIKALVTYRAAYSDKISCSTQ